MALTSSSQHIDNFINQKYQAPHDQMYLPNFNPATGEIYSYVAQSSDHDLQLAMGAATQAFPQWSQRPLEERSKILRRMGDLILKNLDSLALAESIDNGKPLQLAKTVDIPRSAQNFHFFADAITQFSTSSYSHPGHAINYVLQQPLGVVALISPWNLPLYLLTWKIAPALAAGNCVIAKPSELTPMTASLLGTIAIEAGLPPGVLTILHGEGKTIGQAIISHPEIKAVSFTGGTQTGKHIASSVASQLKKVSFELGGKNPALIFSDCNEEKTLQTMVQSSFRNQGQICLASSRLYIEENYYEEFKRKFIALVKNLKVGPPQDAASDLGAVISKEHQQKILSFIESAKSEGGKILTGGEKVLLPPPYHQGWYVAPTVIEGLAPHSKINQEEIFGPVVTLTPFKTTEEVITYANNTRYGLSATVWTQNISRAHHISERLKCGMVWINCWMVRDLRTPFGGQKESGLGREGGFESLKFFTETKNICLNYN